MNQFQVLNLAQSTNTVIKIREPLPTIKEMNTLQSVTRCNICGRLIGEPCYSEYEANRCFPSVEEFEKAYGKDNFLSLIGAV